MLADVQHVTGVTRKHQGHRRYCSWPNAKLPALLLLLSIQTNPCLWFMATCVSGVAQRRNSDGCGTRCKHEQLFVRAAAAHHSADRWGKRWTQPRIATELYEMSSVIEEDEEINDALRGQTTTEDQERVVVNAPMPQVLGAQQQLVDVVKVILQDHFSEIVEVWPYVFLGCIHERFGEIDRITKISSSGRCVFRSLSAKAASVGSLTVVDDELSHHFGCSRQIDPSLRAPRLPSFLSRETVARW